MGTTGGRDGGDGAATKAPATKAPATKSPDDQFLTLYS